jgi:RNA polymerase sigma factor for flagellar operon FliA
MTAEQQKLVVDFMPFAEALAGRYFREKKPVGVDVEDLQACAYLGLCRAATRFDPARGLKFSTYAYHRVLGAIRDAARESRAARGYTKSGRGAKGAEFIEFHDSIQDPSQEPAPEISLRAQHAQLFTHLSALNARERLLVEAVMQGRSLADGGREIGVTKSWASRLYAHAINKLRRMYQQ